MQERETIQTSLVIMLSIDTQTQTLPTVPDLQLSYQATQPQSGASNPQTTHWRSDWFNWADIFNSFFYIYVTAGVFHFNPGR